MDFYDDTNCTGTRRIPTNYSQCIPNTMYTGMYMKIQTPVAGDLCTAVPSVSPTVNPTKMPSAVTNANLTEEDTGIDKATIIWLRNVFCSCKDSVQFSLSFHHIDVVGLHVLLVFCWLFLLPKSKTEERARRLQR